MRSRQGLEKDTTLIYTVFLSRHELTSCQTRTAFKNPCCSGLPFLYVQYTYFTLHKKAGQRARRMIFYVDETLVIKPLVNASISRNSFQENFQNDRREIIMQKEELATGTQSLGMFNPVGDFGAMCCVRRQWVGPSRFPLWMSSIALESLRATVFLCFLLSWVSRLVESRTSTRSFTPQLPSSTSPQQTASL
ncbi:hypothetical protein K435DRAFT_200292 [Dendrothele bispora CBS 962.96]|uniref:Uncharacterized protein n=1 Tax=Dendrothele bispora (strain CBS 962.96) TaxID=1314807 RepID=A0A4S8LTT1_DENBC|nr:hypothetical protein K435DRAFT_200292 [Dendrothele bispora CBS 962.96]